MPIDHVTVRVADLAASRAFYTLALVDPTAEDDNFLEWDDFSLVPDLAITRRLHVAFGVPTRAAVDAWWRRLVDGGYESDGEPGLRPQYHPSYYGAFVRDPDGNSVEAVNHAASREGIDHLWFRTRDVAAAKRFYETIAPVVGLELRHDTPERVSFGAGGGSFSFVRGDEPTENVHLAFGAADRATVERFHEVAVGAGFRSNGEPGERPHYHPGYYGAYVLDPGGHNVEAVFHDRR
ncbi:MAG TPA: VOC family protein [Gaiellaceae bacterium]|nr:VOC family protein [Gaiellaceae bacterium]